VCDEQILRIMGLNIVIDKTDSVTEVVGAVIGDEFT
jgi:hypothetical protein